MPATVALPDAPGRPDGRRKTRRRRMVTRSRHPGDAVAGADSQL